MLGTDLWNISLNSPVIFNNTGGEFNAISPVPKTVGDVVEIMHQIFFNKAPYSFKGMGTRYAEMSADIESKRGVTIWLDRISIGTHINNIGIFMSLNRFFSSVRDHAVVIIPLGMTVADEYTT